MATPLPLSLPAWAKGARIYDGMGSFHRRITTHSQQAQQYFDQGMRFLWVFNHDESTRSFAKALAIDPTCAMCAWGAALTIGPNYNLPMLAKARALIAFQAAQRAKRMSADSLPVEQALIAALQKRYPNAKELNPDTAIPVLVAYADAMGEVARGFPQDLDVQTLYAEALMNIRAWKLWNADGTPADQTPQILATLESVISRDPNHMGALHYYIHALEASPNPEKAVFAAERIRGMAPSAGHLEHMPAHIFHRVGRYEESAEANRKGANADLDYLSKTTPIDYYTMYVGHNFQFLAFSTAAEGRDAETFDAVEKSRASMSDDLLREMPGADWYVAEIYAADVRFGRWDALLARQPPAQDLPGLWGGYLYGTAVALAATGRPAQARERLTQLDALIERTPKDAPAGAGQNSMYDVLTIGAGLVRARIAGAEGRMDDELRELRVAVQREDRLVYDEPSEWFFPVRHVLGARLIASGALGEAESVYRADLVLHPNTGWSLYGLTQVLRLDRRESEARETEIQFHQAWQHATLSIGASAF